MSPRPIIGLEIHVQLATKTKLFCGCAVEYGAPPNSRTCPVCLGMPGVLPVMNRQAVDFAITLGLALNCKIAAHTKWDRKSYFYPDLPKNYQISQYDVPICYEGRFEFPCAGRTKAVRIRRAHLEEDAGKNIHDTPGCTLVDLNRAGTPLLEIVTEPDLDGAEEAYVFCTELQRLVTYLAISEGVMQKGQMRFEPNINVAIVESGAEFRTPISEVKNLNSFRAVRSAIEYEVQRQAAEWRRDPGYLIKKRPNENRGWSDERSATEFQRAKEAAHDYRYFPDPDLVPVEVDTAWIERLRSVMPELPLSRRERLIRDTGLAERDIDVIIADRATADFFDAVCHGSRNGGQTTAQLAGKQFINLWCKFANDRNVTPVQLGVTPERMAGLVKLVADGTVSASAAAQIAPVMLDSDADPAELARKLGLVKVQDVGETEGWVTQAFEANANAVQDALTNPKKAKASEGFLRGAVMKLSGGKADPKLVGELIQKRLKDLYPLD